MASNLWPAVSGTVAQAQLVDTVANNLANMDTQGFKKDLPTFKEYLSVLERHNGVSDIPRGPIKDKDLYPLDGRDQSFVLVDATYSDFKQGGLKVTQSPHDLALDGPGLFEVSTPAGPRFTRSGSFKVTADGLLVTTQGYPVLSALPAGQVPAQPAEAAVQLSQGGQMTQGGVAAGQEDPNLIARYINLRDRTQPLSISESGEVYSGDQLVGKLSVVEFADPKKLRKAENQMFVNTDSANVSLNPVRTSVRQGMIEMSNVNPVEEMSNLIKAHRSFEHGLKAIKAYDEMMGKEVNDIGKL